MGYSRSYVVWSDKNFTSPKNVFKLDQQICVAFPVSRPIIFVSVGADRLRKKKWCRREAANSLRLQHDFTITSFHVAYHDKPTVSVAPVVSSININTAVIYTMDILDQVNKCYLELDRSANNSSVLFSTNWPDVLIHPLSYNHAWAL